MLTFKDEYRETQLAVNIEVLKGGIKKKFKIICIIA